MSDYKESFFKLLAEIEKYIELKRVYFNSDAKNAVQNLTAWVEQEARIKKGIDHYKKEQENENN